MGGVSLWGVGSGEWGVGSREAEGAEEAGEAARAHGQQGAGVVQSTVPPPPRPTAVWWKTRRFLCILWYPEGSHIRGKVSMPPRGNP